MEFDINDIATIGGVADVPGYMLPPEAWTLALNMRYSEDGMQSLDGWAPVFDSPAPAIAPHFAMPVSTATTVYWPYVSLTKAAVWDGITHTDITRVAADYAATDTYQWNGTVLGEVPVFNNGVDQPQVWYPTTLATKMIDLPNFSGFTPVIPGVGTVTRTAKVIRAFGSFLIAGDIVEDSISHPHRVLWSHPADPGDVPPSWDVTDPERDTGMFDLPDVVAGIVMELLPLGNTMFVYKEASIWKMRFVGGQNIFDFGQSSWITTAGLLGQRCVCVTGDGTKHVLATQDDIIWHNGNTVGSILNKRQRKRLQNEIDTNNYFQSFIFSNPFNNEVWFCYPSQGQTYPNRALVMNYRTAGGTDWTVTEADGITFRNAAVGTLEAFVPTDWDTPSDAWDGAVGPWGQLERRRVILLNPAETKFLKLGGVQHRDGVGFPTILQREGISLIGKKRNGEPIVDHRRMKTLMRMWPKIIGGNVNIRFGAQQTVDGSIGWGAIKTFDPTADVYADPGPVTGRAVGIELSSINTVWRLDGYKLDMIPRGEY